MVDCGTDPGTVGVLVADHHLWAPTVLTVGDLQNDVIVEPWRESFFERGGVDSVGQGNSPVSCSANRNRSEHVESVESRLLCY